VAVKREINKVLIANRGVPAVRIIQACRDRGISTVAVYSAPDRLASHVRMADAAVYIGEAPSSESYLNMKKIVGAAKGSGANAIHPGWGFLAENGDFAQMVQEEGLIWIGPPPRAIELLGDKIEAKRLARQADVPTIPGITDVTDAQQVTAWMGEERMDYPIMIKAAAGGGGKGMVRVEGDDRLATALSQARSEAMKAFGDDKLLVEKCIDPAKHIEVQILADEQGEVVHLFERECTLQRRNQKVIEEAPSPSLDDDLRDEICSTAVRLMREIGYTSAGTVEFVFDPLAKRFYFLEVNTRLQVEHGITELITGHDIVSLMLDVAQGERLPFRQSDIGFHGWALEARLNAEDPWSFGPSFGTITHLQVPQGPRVRVSPSVYEGADIPPHYDSLFMLLLSWGPRRAEAIRVMERALGELRVEGVKTLAPLLLSIIRHDAFRKGDFSTRFIERNLEELNATFTGAEDEDELLKVAKYVAQVSALGPQDWM